MNLAKAYFTYQFVKSLTTPWTETAAYKAGLLDERGRLKKSYSQMDANERSAYTLFDRLIFNLKRLVEKVPGGKSRFGSYAAALAFLKENLSERQFAALEKVLEETPTNVSGGVAIPETAPRKKKKPLVLRRRTFKEFLAQ